MKFSLITSIMLAMSLGHMVAAGPVDTTTETKESKEASGALETVHAVRDLAVVDTTNVVGNTELVPALAAIAAFWGGLSATTQSAVIGVVTGLVSAALYDLFKGGISGLVSIFNSPDTQQSPHTAYNVQVDSTSGNSPFAILSSYINTLESDLQTPGGNVGCALIEREQINAYEGSWIWTPVHIPTGYPVSDFDQMCTNSGVLTFQLTSSNTGSTTFYVPSNGMSIESDTANSRIILSYNYAY